MLLLRSLVCVTSLNLLTVHGLSFERDSESPSLPIGPDGFTITIQSSAKISRAPDTANVQLDITEQRSARPKERGDQSASFLLEIETILTQLRPGVSSWNTSIIKRNNYEDEDFFPHRRSYNNEEVYFEPQRVFEEDAGVLQDEPQRTTTRLSIRFVDTALVAPFLNDIKPMRGVKVRHMSSEISDETRAEMKTQLRRKLVEQTRLDGNDYAMAFGRCVNFALEFEELFSYEHEKFDGTFYGFDDGADYTLRPIEMTTEGKTKFNTQTQSTLRCRGW